MTAEITMQTTFQDRRAGWLAALTALTTPPRPCSNEQLARICAEYEAAVDGIAAPTDDVASILLKADALKWEETAEDRGFAGSNAVRTKLWKSLKADIERLNLEA